MPDGNLKLQDNTRSDIKSVGETVNKKECSLSASHTAEKCYAQQCKKTNS